MACLRIWYKSPISQFSQGNQFESAKNGHRSCSECKFFEGNNGKDKAFELR